MTAYYTPFAYLTTSELVRETLSDPKVTPRELELTHRINALEDAVRNLESEFL